MAGAVFSKIYAVVKAIPKGKVLTYGQVATAAGNPRWARVVGYALHSNPDPANIPCHRVVNREGRLADSYVFGGSGVQAEKLLSEGVTLNSDGLVDLSVYGATYKEILEGLEG